MNKNKIIPIIIACLSAMIRGTYTTCPFILAVTTGTAVEEGTGSRGAGYCAACCVFTCASFCCAACYEVHRCCAFSPAENPNQTHLGGTVEQGTPVTISIGGTMTAPNLVQGNPVNIGTALAPELAPAPVPQVMGLPVGTRTNAGSAPVPAAIPVTHQIQPTSERVLHTTLGRPA